MSVMLFQPSPVTEMLFTKNFKHRGGRKRSKNVDNTMKRTRQAQISAPTKASVQPRIIPRRVGRCGEVCEALKKLLSPAEAADPLTRPETRGTGPKTGNILMMPAGS